MASRHLMESMECDSRGGAANEPRPSSGSSVISGRLSADEMLPPSPSMMLPADHMVVMPLPDDKSYCRLANFEIEKKIGRGQFSVVYRAKCRITGSVVALKKVQVSGRGFLEVSRV